MTYYEVKVYIYQKKRALCTALFETKAAMDAFIDSLSGTSELIYLGNIVFRRKDFQYADIKERRIRH